MIIKTKIKTVNFSSLQKNILTILYLLYKNKFSTIVTTYSVDLIYICAPIITHRKTI